MQASEASLQIAVFNGGTVSITPNSITMNYSQNNQLHPLSPKWSSPILVPNDTIKAEFDFANFSHLDIHYLNTELTLELPLIDE